MTEQPNLFDPPYQRHSPTSRAAATQAKPAAATLRRKVLDTLLACEGMTDEELQEHLHLNPSTERPRRIELVQAGLVRDSGESRKTHSGRYAVIWEAVRDPVNIVTVKVRSGVL